MFGILERKKPAPNSAVATLERDLESRRAGHETRYTQLIAESADGIAVDADELATVMHSLGKNTGTFSADVAAFIRQRDFQAAIDAADDARAELEKLAEQEQAIDSDLIREVTPIVAAREKAVASIDARRRVLFEVLDRVDDKRIEAARMADPMTDPSGRGRANSKEVREMDAAGAVLVSTIAKLVKVHPIAAKSKTRSRLVAFFFAKLQEVLRIDIIRELS